MNIVQRNTTRASAILGATLVTLSLLPGAERKLLIATLDSSLPMSQTWRVQVNDWSLGANTKTSSIDNIYTSSSPTLTRRDIRNISGLFSEGSRKKMQGFGVENLQVPGTLRRQAFRYSSQARKSNNEKILHASWINMHFMSLATIKVDNHLKSLISQKDAKVLVKSAQFRQGSALLPFQNGFSLSIRPSRLTWLFGGKLSTLVSTYLPKRVSSIYFGVTESDLAVLSLSPPSLPLEGRALLLSAGIFLLVARGTKQNSKAALVIAISAALCMLRIYLAITVPIFIAISSIYVTNRLKGRRCKLLAANSLLTMFLLSAGVGIIAIVKNARGSLHETTQQNQSRIGKHSSSSPQLMGELKIENIDESPLGYSYERSTEGFASKTVKGNRNGETKQVYSVKYTIDKYGNRLTVNQPSKSSTLNAAFLGGSFTFGEGLENSETLPSQFSAVSGYKSFNFGMSGYGPHQALTLMLQPDNISERWPRQKIDLYVYRVIPHHVKRNAGESSWDRESTIYEVDSQKGGLKAITFAERALSPVTFSEYAGSALAYYATISNDSLLILGSRLFQDTRVLDRRKEHEQRENFFAVIAAMNSLATANGALFTVILDEQYTGLDSCTNEKSGFTKEAEKRLKMLNIDFFSTVDIYPSKLCSSGALIIQDDGHPTSTANKILARKLGEHIRQKS